MNASLVSRLSSNRPVKFNYRNLQHLICLARRNMPPGIVNSEMDREVSAFSGEEIELLIRPAYLCVCFFEKGAHVCMSGF